MSAGAPPEITMDPGTAVLLNWYTGPASQPRNVCSRSASFSGGTQPKSVKVRSAGRTSPDPAAVVLAWFRKPQPPPRLSAMNGTGTLWVTSMTESTSPPVPQ